MLFILVTRDTSHLDRSWSKDIASLNILFISVTLDTFHLDMSWLKDGAPQNSKFMSVICETSHSPIGPLSEEQSTDGDSRWHNINVCLSSAVVFGENVAMVVAEEVPVEVLSVQVVVRPVPAFVGISLPMEVS